MTCKNTRIISYSAHISTPYLWFITLSAWCMFNHENYVPFKCQHYENTHITTTNKSHIFTGNNQETMSHKGIVSYQSPFKKSLHVKDWSGLDNKSVSGHFCHIPVLSMRVYASRFLFLIIVNTHMCHGCVCVWGGGGHVCLSQVSQVSQDWINHWLQNIWYIHWLPNDKDAEWDV